MPKELKNDDPSLVQASSFSMARNDEMNDAQATETYKVKANEAHLVGSGGEKIGFAKYQVTEVLAPVFAEQAKLKQLNDEKKTLREQIAAAPDEETKTALNKDLAALGRQTDNLEGKIGMMAINSAEFLQSAGALYEKQKAIEQAHIAPDDDLGLLTRSVTTSTVGQLLATDRPAVAEERFGIDSEGKTIGISVQADGAGVLGDFGDPKKSCFLNIDYSDPEIQRGLADLEVDDYVNGQMDRHAGNIFIDPKSKSVTGIDNDLAFPEVSREELQQRRGAAFKGTEGMPKQISAEKAAKILSVTPAELEQAIRDTPRPANAKPLSDSAIEGAKQRLVQLQTAIKDPNSGVKVVSQFNENTYQAAIKAQVKAFHNEPTNKAKGIKFGKFDKNAVDNRVDQAYDSCPKTSYLGAIELVKQQKTLAINTPDVAAKHGMREAKTVTKAAREPDVDAYLQQEAQAKKDILNKPASLDDKVLGAQIGKLQQDMAPMKQAVVDLQQKIEKLEKPGLGTRLKEKILGDKDRINEIKALRGQQQELHKRLKPMQQELNDSLNQAVAPQRAEMEQKLELKRAQLAPALDQVNDIQAPAQQQHHSVREDLHLPPAQHDHGHEQSHKADQEPESLEQEEEPEHLSVKEKMKLFEKKAEDHHEQHSVAHHHH